MKVYDKYERHGDNVDSSLTIDNVCFLGASTHV